MRVFDWLRRATEYLFPVEKQTVTWGDIYKREAGLTLCAVDQEGNLVSTVDYVRCYLDNTWTIVNGDECILYFYTSVCNPIIKGFMSGLFDDELPTFDRKDVPLHINAGDSVSVAPGSLRINILGKTGEINAIERKYAPELRVE